MDGCFVGLSGLKSPHLYAAMMTALTRHRLKSLLISLIGRNSKKAARRNHDLAIFSAITATLFFAKTERLLLISPTIEGITISRCRKVSGENISIIKQECSM